MAKWSRLLGDDHLSKSSHDVGHSGFISRLSKLMLDIDLPKDPAIPPLPKEITQKKWNIHTKACTRISKEALFIYNCQKWKSPMHPSIGEYKQNAV